MIRTKYRHSCGRPLGEAVPNLSCVTTRRPAGRDMQLGEQQMNRLAGKVAVITGAGAGIGRASANMFVAEGAKVVVAEIDEALGEANAR
jgi:3-oxoacyl-ACP reductase-like protein